MKALGTSWLEAHRVSKATPKKTWPLKEMPVKGVCFYSLLLQSRHGLVICSVNLLSNPKVPCWRRWYTLGSFLKLSGERGDSAPNSLWTRQGRSLHKPGSRFWS